jgi:hypothetical protein
MSEENVKQHNVEEHQAEQETDGDVYGLELEEYQFKIKKNGELLPHKLIGLTGPQRKTFMNLMQKHMKIKGNRVYQTLEDRDERLLSMCLYDCSNDPKGVRVPRSVIDNYPGKLITKLTFRAMDMSGLSTDAVDEEKND